MSKRTTDFEKTLRQHVYTYPALYHCRANALNEIFCTSGSWIDGRVGKRQTAQNLAKFVAHQDAEDKKRNEDSNSFRKERGLRELQVRQTVRPTEAQLDAILADIDTPRRLFGWQTQGFYANRLKTAIQKGDEESFWVRHSGPTLFAPLYDYYAINNVPDDVRPDWLEGIRETICMIYRYDKPEQAQAAKQIQVDLEARFGPMHNWHKLQRRPSPPKAEDPRDIVGREVRLDFGDERSWAEHRPYLGPNVYRSLNQTLSNLKLALPLDHPDIVAGRAKNGKQCNVGWGHLITGTEPEYGTVKPKAVIGVDKTPVGAA